VDLLDFLFPFREQIARHGFHVADALAHRLGALDAALVFGLERLVGALQFAAREGGDFLEPGERVAELFLRGLLAVAGRGDAFLQQVAFVDAEFFIGGIVGGAAAGGGGQAQEGQRDRRPPGGTGFHKA